MMNSKQSYTRIPGARSDSQTAGSSVRPTDDGSWRAVWRGQHVSESFPTRQRALEFVDRCDRAGRLLETAAA